MLDRKIKVIRAMALEKDEFYPRYIVVDTETGEVVDDAQGWGGGYMSPQKAYAAHFYRNPGEKAHCVSCGSVNEQIQAEAAG